MGNILFWRIILWGTPAIAAVIIFFANYMINDIDQKNKKEKEKIETVRAEEKEKKLHTIITDSIAKKEKHPSPNKKTEKKNKPEDTYNVTSNNQTGGITTGKLEINVAKEEQVNELNIPLNENYLAKFDKTNLRFECNPKVGKWEKPYIAVSFEEKESYKKFGNQSLMLTGAAFGIDGVIGKTRLYAASCGMVSYNDMPATSKFFYYMEFNTIPSYIVFGDYGNVLYKYNTSNGSISLF